LQLRLYLLNASSTRNAGMRPATGSALYEPFPPATVPVLGELVLSAPEHQQKQQPVAWQIIRRRRERQIEEAMLALETTPRPLDIALTSNGRKRRDYDKPTLLAEDSTPDTQGLDIRRSSGMVRHGR
jgi:hypothetical protein